MHKGKKVIVLGVTGGIAAYKAATLTSKLCQANYDVHVIMTDSAQQFITPLTFQTLSRNPVVSGLWEQPRWEPEHVALADIADLLVIAPCTVNCLAKLAWGLADDALSTYAVTHNQQVLLAPAMNPKMWQNPAVKQNVELLKSRNVELLGPAAGRVACGTEGLGRMVEPEQIFERICQILPPEASPRIPTHSRD